MSKSISSADKKKQSVFFTVLIIIFTSFILSVVTASLIDPLGLYAGGVTGIAQIILHALGLIFKQDWNYFKAEKI